MTKSLQQDLLHQDRLQNRTRQTARGQENDSDKMLSPYWLELHKLPVIAAEQKIRI